MYPRNEQEISQEKFVESIESMKRVFASISYSYFKYIPNRREV